MILYLSLYISSIINLRFGQIISLFDPPYTVKYVIRFQDKYAYPLIHRHPTPKLPFISYSILIKINPGSIFLYTWSNMISVEGTERDILFYCKYVSLSPLF